MEYVWDEVKNAINLEKHGIEFSEVVGLLDAGETAVDYDDEHSTHDEERFIYTGFLAPHGMIMVVVADVNDEISRIVSARKV